MGLYLGGNIIPLTALPSFGYAGFGHLQIVYRRAGSVKEIEVQMPRSTALLGTWDFSNVGANFTLPDGVSENDPTSYRENRLNIGDRKEADVWQLMQVIMTVTFILVVAFRLIGGTYQAAVLSAGFAGVALGATPTAIADMSSVTKRYGAAPMAFIVLPLVSAFFVGL